MTGHAASRAAGAARSTRARTALLLLAAAVTACTPPIRQYDLKNQKLTCEQANQYVYRTLENMGFKATAFEPARSGHPGTLHAHRDERGGAQDVTVIITCTDGNTAVDASEDGRWLGQLEFKRAFYLAFTATATQGAISEAAEREEFLRPLQDKQGKGLRVLLQPVSGLGAKLDFALDLAAAGILPVRVTINNSTPRTYSLDPNDIVLVQKDGTRVHPMDVSEATQRVAERVRQEAAAGKSPTLDAGAIAERLQSHLLSSRSVTASQLLNGYLYFPLAPYVKGRVTLEDQETEESEGFVVEF